MRLRLEVHFNKLYNIDRTILYKIYKLIGELIKMKNTNKNEDQKSVQSFAYYSRLLKEPFDTVEELNEAEEAYYAKQKAKEVKAAQKKSDAQRVEDAFKMLNAARKTYKEQLTTITENYSNELKELKEAFLEAKEIVEKNLAYAESTYQDALKAFTDKYPECYHLTLKDGDFETTISHEAKGDTAKLSDIVDLFYKFW
jgi:DNA repair exonuclease SbcCD ATPase subunit